MPDVLRDAFGSKKFLVFLASVLVAGGNKLAGHFGYELDSDTVNQFLAIAAAYIVGQGIADHGKEAAKVANERPSPSSLAIVPPPSSSQAGFARLPVLLAIAAVGAILLGACSPSAQQKAVSNTLTAVNAASAAFVAFDASHQQAIVAQAPDKATGAAELASYRVEQNKVLTLLTAAYKAVAIAATTVNQPNVDGMLAAAAQLASELTALGVKP